MMKLNRSVGEQSLIQERRPEKKHSMVNSPQKLKKINMQKAKSFKQSKINNELSDSKTTKSKSNKTDFANELKANKRPSTNRIEQTSKESSPQKKIRVKPKKKCCNGRGG